MYVIPIRAPDQILDRFYVIGMEFLLLRHRCLSGENVPSSKEQGQWLFSQARFVCLLVMDNVKMVVAKAKSDGNNNYYNLTYK